MPHELEYIVDKAVVMCNQGAKPGFFCGTNNPNVKINGCKVCIATDKEAIKNIPEFGVCAKTGSPCVPVPTMWTDTYKVKVKGQQTLLYKSKLPCGAGGMVEFVTSGQVPVSEEDLDELMDEHGEDAEDEGWGWWDTAELIPVVGSIIGMVREGAKGNWGMVAANVGFLVLDVAGVVSFGGTTAISTGLKTAGKVATKTVAKSTLKAGAKKAAAKVLTKQGAKALGKSLAKKVDDIAKATMKVCVFACFPAGTPVHTKDGIKSIEDIQVGDLVWAYNEETGETALQEVTATMQREVDATVYIELEGETIETTAEHPFYTQDGWKDAADLQTGDKILTKENKEIEVRDTKFNYEPKKVFNFEVAHWHTYFVGLLAWLVHNARVCASAVVKKFRRSMSERAKALMRDAKNPKSDLTKEAREFILKHKGEKVPKGYEVSHEIPLYTSRTVKGKTGLDKARNMRTQPKPKHRKRHMRCGDQYHEYGPSNKPRLEKMID